MFENIEKLKKDHAAEIALAHHTANLEQLNALKAQKADHDAQLLKQQQDHDFAMRDLQFKMDHFKEVELDKARSEKDKAIAERDVANNENKMLREMIKFESDIIDVKNLVTSLINKLPEINLSSLTVQSK